jgi:hypothetical protein
MLPSPPDPSANIAQPWFRLWGPAWTNLQFAAVPPGRPWLAHLHERDAYRSYMRDDLAAAVRSAEAAIACGVRANQWAAQLHYLAAAERSARESAARVQHSPFTFESASGEPAPAELLRIVEATVESAREALGFEPGRITVTVLDDEELPHHVGSRYAYLTRRPTGDRICLLPNPMTRLEAAAEGFLREYVRLALDAPAAGRAPRWLLEGLTEWVAQKSDVPLPPAPPPAEAARRPSLGERTLERALGRSPIDCAVRRGLNPVAVVNQLHREHGSGGLRRFAEALRSMAEAPAFERAFGLRQSQLLGRADQ